jgi:hypothetical protein
LELPLCLEDERIEAWCLAPCGDTILIFVRLENNHALCYTRCIAGTVLLAQLFCPHKSVRADLGFHYSFFHFNDSALRSTVYILLQYIRTYMCRINIYCKDLAAIKLTLTFQESCNSPCADFKGIISQDCFVGGVLQSHHFFP